MSTAIEREQTHATFARITFLFCLGAGTTPKPKPRKSPPKPTPSLAPSPRLPLGILPDTITSPPSIGPLSQWEQQHSGRQRLAKYPWRRGLQLSNIWDITNDTAADATTGDGSLLGGLVTWTSINIQWAACRMAKTRARSTAPPPKASMHSPLMASLAYRNLPAEAPSGQRNYQ